MDFTFSEEQQQLRETIERFVRGDYGVEHRRAIVASGPGWSREAWSGLAELGVLAINVPESLGGLGFGPVETLLAMQASAPALLCEPLLASAVVATVLVREHAGDPAREQMLTAMAAGELIAVLAHDEAEARGRNAWVATRARRVGDGFEIDGHKSVVMHAGAADTLLVSARLSGEPGDVDGVALFRVPAATPGLELQEYPTIDGRRAAEVRLHAVALPASALLGAEDRALPAIERALDVGLAALCAEAVGLLQATVDTTIEYLKTRQQFGKPIGRFQALQHRAADMLLHVEQSRSMSLLAAMRCDSGDAAPRQQVMSAAKVVIGQACRFVGEQSVQLHGGMGMTDELMLSHWFKRLLAIEASFGDTDFHLQRFAQLSQRVALQTA
jgi:hypothetical protein